MKFVAIVDAGQDGGWSRARGDYRELNNLILRVLDALPGGLNEQFVRVVKTTGKALAALARTTDDNAVLVFTTRDMFYEARWIQAANPQLRVVLVPEAPSKDLFGQGVTIINPARLWLAVEIAERRS